MATIVLGFFTAFAIVFLSTPALIKVARLKGLVDLPDDDRKIHRRLIPQIGGIIIFGGTLISYLLWYPWIRDDDFRFIAASLTILFFVGVKDDFIGTAATKKLIAHIAVAFILVVIAGIKITNMYGLLGVRDIPEWASILLSVFTYTVIVNAFNLIDGIDGLAAGVGSIACLAFGTWFYLVGSTETAALAFTLSGALLAFLIFNFEPARIFMGDSGSLTIGLIISVLSIKLIEFDAEKLPPQMFLISKPIFTMAVMVYPLADTLRIFIYRTAKGLSPFAPDRNHLHHKFMDLGLSHRTTVLIIYLFTLLMIALAVFYVVEANIKFVVMAFITLLFTQVPTIVAKLKARK